MTGSRAPSKLILILVNTAAVLGMILSYRNPHVDRLSLIAIGIVFLLVFNGMFFLARKTEPDLPQPRLKQLNKWVVWPIVLLSVLVYLLDWFSHR
jgi:hypothetical protein